MPLILPHAPQFSRYESNAATNPSGNFGTAVNNPAGAANTKNTTWTELIASTAFDALYVQVIVGVNNAANTNTATLIDIGIGASTAESVLIPDLLAGFSGQLSGGGGGPRHYMFPLRVPAGSRISARAASVRTSGSTRVEIQLWGGPRNPDMWWSGQQVVAYGINTADSGAVSVTAGNSGAEGTVTSIGTTSQNHEAFVVGVQGNKGSYTGGTTYHFDLGLETTSTAWLIRDFYQCHVTSGEIVGMGGFPWFPVFAQVPSGTVLAMAGESSGTAEAFDFAVYGVS